ncbi:MAG: hypothetical protein F6K63_13740 [Moorea sp. SIO1G6]|nr:hypothetical protein [Moorena sp. SIO1G6]NET65382.1 hypothetical protein [Moorena sp. SIO1G6]
MTCSDPLEWVSLLVSIQLSAFSRQFLNKRGKLWPWPVATLREWPRYANI